MAGSKEGGLKAVKSTKARHGDDFYKKIGQIGGRNGHTGGFYANPKLARIAGKKGGLISQINSERPLEERREEYRRKYETTK